MIESYFVGVYNFCKKRCTRFEVWRGFLQKRVKETRTTALLSKIHIMSNILEAKQDKDSSYHPLAKMIPRHAHLKICDFFASFRNALQCLSFNKKTVQNLDFTMLLTGSKFLILNLDSACVTMT
jgi:hypothetical protein